MMPRLSLRQRERALGQIQAGMRPSVVAATFACHVSTIQRLVARHNLTGTTDDRPRSGRPRVTTPRQDRGIHLTHLRDRFRPASVTACETPGTHNPRVSADTIRRRLRERGLHARRPYAGSRLTVRHRQQRLQWCLQHRHWLQRDWQRVLFTDESRYCIDRADGRVRVWRRRGERLADVCIRENDRWGGAHVMVWAGISHRHRTQLVFLEIPGRGAGLTAQGYIDQVLRPVVLPFMQGREGFQLQQDNARPHVARITQQFLGTSGVEVLGWPAMSPDLAPIEHLWDELGRRLRNRQPQPTNAAQLRDALVAEWDIIPQETIDRLVASMRARCTACIAAKGGHTGY